MNETDARPLLEPLASTAVDSVVDAVQELRELPEAFLLKQDRTALANNITCSAFENLSGHPDLPLWCEAVVDNQLRSVSLTDMQQLPYSPAVLVVKKVRRIRHNDRLQSRAPQSQSGQQRHDSGQMTLFNFDCTRLVLGYELEQAELPYQDALLKIVFGYESDRRFQWVWPIWEEDGGYLGIPPVGQPQLPNTGTGYEVEGEAG